MNGFALFEPNVYAYAAAYATRDNPGETLWELLASLVYNPVFEGNLVLTLGHKTPPEPLRQSYPLGYRAPFDLGWVHESMTATPASAGAGSGYAFARVVFANKKRVRHYLIVPAPDAPAPDRIYREIKKAPKPQPKFLPVK